MSYPEHIDVPRHGSKERAEYEKQLKYDEFLGIESDPWTSFDQPEFQYEYKD